MYQPVQDRVVIQPLQAFKSAGGIIFSDNSVPKSVEGMVMAVGPGKANKKGIMVPMGVSVGEKVLFERGQGDEDHRRPDHVGGQARTHHGYHRVITEHHPARTRSRISTIRG
jgi:chaperonin GroES